MKVKRFVLNKNCLFCVMKWKKKHFMKLIRKPSILAVHIAKFGPPRKTNQNSSFHRGQVLPLSHVINLSKI